MHFQNLSYYFLMFTLDLLLNITPLPPPHPLAQNNLSVQILHLLSYLGQVWLRERVKVVYCKQITMQFYVF